VAITVTMATLVTDELVASLNHLLPQLSTTAQPLTMSSVNEIVNSPASTLFLATDDDQNLVGTLTLVAFVIPTGLRVWIEDVVVDEAGRGMGVGEALTISAIKEASRLGARSIDLTSRPSRAAANSLYQRLGFEPRETNVYRFSVETQNQ
jgi:ribosomal protein S18 acetylase RimI-like enzyme